MIDHSLGDCDWTRPLAHADRVHVCRKIYALLKNEKPYSMAAARTLSVRVCEFEHRIFKSAKSRDEYLSRLSSDRARIFCQFEDQPIATAEQEQTLHLETIPQYQAGDRQHDENGNMAFNPHHPQVQHPQFFQQQRDAQQNNSNCLEAEGQRDPQEPQIVQTQVQNGQQIWTDLEQREYEKLEALLAGNAPTMHSHAHEQLVHTHAQMAHDTNLMYPRSPVLLQQQHNEQLPDEQMPPDQSIMIPKQQLQMHQMQPLKAASSKKVPMVSKLRARGGSSTAANCTDRGRAKKSNERSTPRARNESRKESRGQHTLNTEVKSTAAIETMATEDLLSQSNLQRSLKVKPGPGSSREGRAKTSITPTKAQPKINTAETTQGQTASITGVQTTAVGAARTLDASNTNGIQKFNSEGEKRADFHPGSPSNESKAALPRGGGQSSLGTAIQTEEQSVRRMAMNEAAAQGILLSDKRDIAAPSDEHIWTEIKLLQDKYRADLHEMAPFAEILVDARQPAKQEIFRERLAYCLYIADLERSLVVPPRVTKRRLILVDNFSRLVIARTRKALQDRNRSSGAQHFVQKRSSDSTQEENPRKKRRDLPPLHAVEKAPQDEDPRRSAPAQQYARLSTSCRPGEHGSELQDLHSTPQAPGTQFALVERPRMMDARRMESDLSGLHQGADYIQETGTGSSPGVPSVRKKSNYSLDSQNRSGEGEVVIAKTVYKVSTEHGMHFPEKPKRENVHNKSLKNTVEMDIRAVQALHPYMSVDLSEEFGRLIVSCQLLIEEIKLPKLFLTVPSGYPSEGEVTFGFERPQLGWAGVIGDIRDRFKRSLTHAPGSVIGLTVILDAWAHEAECIVDRDLRGNR